MGVYLKTLLAVVIVTFADWLLHRMAWWHMPEGPLEIFYGVFGVVYAIIVGFAMYEALNNYSQIRQYMNSEVNELQDLRDYLMYIDGQELVVREIRAGLKRYADSVVTAEWPAMTADQRLDVDTPEELYSVMRSIKSIEPQNDRDLLAVERLVNTLAEITTHRTNRITASVERLPGLLIQLLASLSLFMVIAFTLITIDSPLLKTLLTLANSSAIAFIYFVILDLDYPFHGVWSLRPVPFEQFLERCRASESPEVG